MVQIRNTSRLPALVQGYWLYPGETRSVPAKVAALLVGTNPQLVICHAVQPPQQAGGESQVGPEVEDFPEPDDQPEASQSVRKRRK